MRNRIQYGITVHNYRTAMYGLFYGKKSEMKRVEEMLNAIEDSKDDDEINFLTQEVFDNYGFIDEINYRSIDKDNIYTDINDNRYRIINNCSHILYY